MPPRRGGSRGQAPVVLPWEKPEIDLPDSQTETKKWLTITDKICKDRFDPSKPLPNDYHRRQPESAFAGTMNDDVLQEIVGARRLACIQHLQISENATRLFTENEFEEKWLAFGKEAQEKRLLSAFKDQEAIPNNGLRIHGPDKLNCPELCRDRLLRDGGQGFLDLISNFLLDDNDVTPTQPFVLPNARFDAIIGWADTQNKPCLRATLDLRRVLRTCHISKLTVCSTSLGG